MEGESRRAARKDFAADCGTKWGHLWELGYRAKAVKPGSFCIVLNSKITAGELRG